MKLLFTLPLLLLAGILSAQTVDLEDRDDSFIVENSKNIQKIEIQEPFFMVKPRGCADFRPAAFEGGVSAYKELLSKYMYEFLNSDFYAINGTFTFTLTIDQNGRVTHLRGAPKIENSAIFFDDMLYVVRRIKKNWTPAQCYDKKIASEVKLKMNFTSVTADF